MRNWVPWVVKSLARKQRSRVWTWEGWPDGPAVWSSHMSGKSWGLFPRMLWRKFELPITAKAQYLFVGYLYLGDLDFFWTFGQRYSNQTPFRTRLSHPGSQAVEGLVASLVPRHGHLAFILVFSLKTSKKSRRCVPSVYTTRFLLPPPVFVKSGK